MRVAVVLALAFVACTKSDGTLCERFASQSCICGPYASEPGAVAIGSCGPDIGANAYCCNAGNECGCARPICLFTSTTGACSCTWGLFTFDPAGDERTTCAPPPGGGVCCKAVGTGGETTCTCSSGTTCNLGVEVASCGPSDVAGCSEGSTAIATCEGFESMEP